MLHHRKKLDMRETGIMDVIGKKWGQLAIGHPTIAFLRDTFPRAEMHFIERYWRTERIIFYPVRHPRIVMPGVAFEIPYTGSCLRTKLRGETIWITFVHLIIAQARFDVIFVRGSLTDIGHKPFPNACRGRAHDRGRRIPIIEVSDD